jgi:hypothetical protein
MNVTSDLVFYAIHADEADDDVHDDDEPTLPLPL